MSGPKDGIQANQGGGAVQRGEGAVPGWASSLTRLLDDFVRIPGTDFRVGLDAVIGFFLPGVGDAMTSVGSLSLLWLALKRRVPTVVLVRMVMNIAVDAALGAIPFLGDLFDAAWRANRKNLELVRRYQQSSSARARARDYLVVAAGIVVALLAVALPIAGLWWLLAELFGG